MSIRCIIGAHPWKGCKCTQCDKTRDEHHDWSKDCEKCHRCGKIRDVKHNWGENNEKCLKCSITYLEFLRNSLTKRETNVELAISQITDQKILREIICTVEDHSVIRAAINNLRDENIMIDLVESTSEISKNTNMIGYYVMESEKLPALNKVYNLMDEVFRDEGSTIEIGNNNQYKRIIQLIELGKPFLKYIANCIIGMIPSSGQNKSELIYQNIGLLCLALTKIGGAKATSILYKITKMNFYNIYEFKYLIGAIALGLAYIGLTDHEASEVLKKLNNESNFGPLKNINNYLIVDDLGSDILGVNIDNLNY